MFILPASSKYVNIPLVTNWTGFRTLFNVRLRGEIFVNAIHDRVGCWMNKDILHHTGWHRGRNFRLGVGRCCCPFQCRLYRQITQTGMFLEIPLGFEFVAQSASEIFQIFSRCCLKKRERERNRISGIVLNSRTDILITVVQYSCIGWVSLWCFETRPVKKQVWHMSKLKHLRHRYLFKRGYVNKRILNNYAYADSRADHPMVICRTSGRWSEWSCIRCTLIDGGPTRMRLTGGGPGATRRSAVRASSRPRSGQPLTGKYWFQIWENVTREPDDLFLPRWTAVVCRPCRNKTWPTVRCWILRRRLPHLVLAASGRNRAGARPVLAHRPIDWDRRLIGTNLEKMT